MTQLPGATAISRLWVYDWPTADGLAGGTPHLHTASTEAYVVIAGSGAVETLDSTGFHSTRLESGSLLWFTPGTVHRLINESGDLELLVIMQNAGLPEAGDAVLTFPPEILRDAGRYRRAARLPDDPDTAENAARQRRDLAIEGYLDVRDRVEHEGPQALAPLRTAAADLVAARVPDWQRLWQTGPHAQTTVTGRHLEALRDGDGTHLDAARLYSAEAAPRLGMCGRLLAWSP